MLVNFFIDPDAIDNNTTRSHVRALHRKWRTLGVLAHPSQDDGGFENIRRKFPQLEQGIQRRWVLLWREIEHDPTCYPRRRDDFRVALVSRKRAEDRQIDKGDSAYFRGNLGSDVEWVRLTEINDSREFEHAENLATTPISENQPVQRLWQDRFQALAKTSQEIVIIDRYTAVESFYCRDGAQSIDCELFRLLDLIEQDSINCTVTVYSSCDVGRTTQNRAPALEDLKDFLRSEIRNRAFENIEEVTLYLPNNHNFSSNEARDRFMRFGCKVCHIGHGIDIFKGRNVSIGTPFTTVSNAETLDYVRGIETYLEGRTNPTRNIVRVPCN